MHKDYYLFGLKKAIKTLHGVSAKEIEEVSVIEKFRDETIWQGIVYVFRITGHPKADICYAWSSPIEGSTKRRYYAVLKIPPIDTPEKAVRASIIRDHQTK